MANFVTPLPPRCFVKSNRIRQHMTNFKTPYPFPYVRHKWMTPKIKCFEGDIC